MSRRQHAISGRFTAALTDLYQEADSPSIDGGSILHARYQKLYFKATCIWRIVLALVITPKVDGVCALAEGVFQFG